ncbi:MAG: hypothetical protein V7696_15890 [Halioglobus sp.]
MNTNFKPLGLVAAVAAATAGYTGVTQAQTFAGTGLGDAAVVPYYTVQGDFVTGVHITNTSAETQVVKLRYRRASDSMDALDFNIIMSPYDMWTGSIRDVDGTIRVGTTDTSCTAPQTVADTGIAEMGDIFREGAEEGYIEIIGMGSASAATAPWIYLGSLHTPLGTPVDCGSVETNFFRNATTGPSAGPGVAPLGIGVLSDTLSNQACSEIIGSIASPTWTSCAAATAGLTNGINAGGTASNNLGDTGNVLNVTYFVRSAETGTEFGSRAVHIADFNASAMMSNQEIIVIGSTDYYSFLYPNLDGGSPVGTATGRFNGVRTALGAQEVINEWSTNAANAVSTDWVVTMPGQYLMLNLRDYTTILDAGGDIDDCLNAAQAAAVPAASGGPLDTCDARDLPVTVDIEFWDREEQQVTTPQGGLVISPQTTDRPDSALLENEVNVIEWTDGTNAPVLDSAYATSFNVAALGSPNGWAQLSVTADATTGKVQAIYQPALDTPAVDAPVNFVPVADAGASVPIVGFAAWERTFANNAAASYGRIIDHAYINAAASGTAPAPAP